MIIELEDILDAIRKENRKCRNRRNKSIQAKPTENALPTKIDESGIKPSQNAHLLSKVPTPERSVCPLTPVEQCLYGFYTNLCFHCQALRQILDQIRFDLPECDAVEHMKDKIKQENLDEFGDRLESLIELDPASSEYFAENFMGKLECKLGEKGLAELSLNQLEIIKAIFLLKKEPEDSIIYSVIEELAKELISELKN